MTEQLVNLYNSGPVFFWLLGAMYTAEFAYIAYLVIRQKLGIEDKPKPKETRWRRDWP